MNRFLLLFLSLIWTNLIIAQDITGTIKDAEDHSILAYVSLEVVGKTLGTVSREDGTYKIKSNTYLKDSDKIKISMIGYEDYIVSVNTLIHNPTIYLVPKSDVLHEILIVKKQIKKFRIGNDEVGKMLMKFYSIHDTSVDDLLGVEQGMIFDVENDFLINKISFAIGCNEYKMVKLRLKFYEVDQGELGQLLNREDIIITIEEEQKGLFELDLDRYNLVIKDKKELGVTLEWIGGLIEGESPKCFGITYKTGKNRDGIFKRAGDKPGKKLKQDMTLFLDVTEVETE